MSRTPRDASPEPHRKPLTGEEGAERIEALRRAYDNGYLSRDLFETLRREVEIRVKPAA